LIPIAVAALLEGTKIVASFFDGGLLAFDGGLLAQKT
jgi:hypothetical protein